LAVFSAAMAGTASINARINAYKRRIKHLYMAGIGLICVSLGYFCFAELNARADESHA
jgi:hypothetical protein